MDHKFSYLAAYVQARSATIAPPRMYCVSHFCNSKHLLLGKSIDFSIRSLHSISNMMRVGPRERDPQISSSPSSPVSEKHGSLSNGVLPSSSGRKTKAMEIAYIVVTMSWALLTNNLREFHRPGAGVFVRYSMALRNCIITLCDMFLII